MIRLVRGFLLMVIAILLIVVTTTCMLLLPFEDLFPTRLAEKPETRVKEAKPAPVEYWTPPDSNKIMAEPNGELIFYGRQLIKQTAEYLGPNGKVKAVSNGMNCQNCHLDAGTRIFGNNYSAVASTYPKFRDRSGMVESIPKRINDCFERSLNGSALPEDGKEMQAMIAYMEWLGRDVPKGKGVTGVGLLELSFLDIPADPQRGEALYQEKCARCHGKTGEGVMNVAQTAWTYPPLWGPRSFNEGAGLHRLSRLAGYIKANMPFDTSSFEKPELTDEESWHLAAFICSMPRPAKDISKDWPDVTKKPIDHPFGPYTDGFDERQHKYGPFKPIVEKRKTSE